MGPTSAAAVANWFLDKADSEGLPLDQLQVQKLVYYSQAWFLANTNTVLFYDDIRAWPHGPMISSLWEQFREYGRSAIRDRARELAVPPGSSWKETEYVIARMNGDDPKKNDLLEKVWQAYGKGKFTGVQLSNMTHSPNEPWEIVRRREPSNSRPIITPNLLMDAFKKKMPARASG